MSNSGPIARILLRVLAGALMALGYTDAATFVEQDPDLLLLTEEYLPQIFTFIGAASEAVIGAGVWIGTELWYRAAKRFGWST